MSLSNHQLNLRTTVNIIICMIVDILARTTNYTTRLQNMASSLLGAFQEVIYLWVRGKTGK